MLWRLLCKDFFVPQEVLLPSPKAESPSRIDLLILANAKKMNLTFDELNLFRLRDFIEFTNIYYPPTDQEPTTIVKMATQDEIDDFYGR